MKAERQLAENMLEMVEDAGRVQLETDTALVILVGYFVAMVFATEVDKTSAAAIGWSAGIGYWDLQCPRESVDVLIVADVLSHRRNREYSSQILRWKYMLAYSMTDFPVETAHLESVSCLMGPPPTLSMGFYCLVTKMPESFEVRFAETCCPIGQSMQVQIQRRVCVSY